MVYFEDNFWGEKNSGYDALYHTMKYGLNASREFADFIRDRASVEEGYAKSLSKICKPTSSGICLGTFEPCWNIIKSSTEILANSHSQVVHKLHELIKSIRDYGETQKETHKALKDDLSSTAEVVNLIQTKTAAVLKAKETYYSRCQEFEKVKKETTNAKDIEKAEQKKIRAGEEYKMLIEKREEIRKTFHAKMIETAKKFEDLEVTHLKSMSEHLLSYIVSLESGQKSVEQVISHFKKQVHEQTTDKLLDHFVKEKGTGRNVPDEIVFEEFAATGSLVELEVEESPNLNSRGQSISAFRKKKKKEKEKEPKEPKERKTKKKKEKEKVPTPNGTLGTSPDSNSIEGLPANDAAPEVDEEGYRIIPKDAESTKSHDSDSDSDSDDDDEPKKFQITIKPAAEKTTASLDEFRSIQLTLPTLAVWQRKSESSSLDGDFPKTAYLNEPNLSSSHKFSKSQEDLLSIDFSQTTFPGPPVNVPPPTTSSSLSTNHNQLMNVLSSPVSSSNTQVGDLDKLSSVNNTSDKPPELAPKKKNSLKNRSNPDSSSPALPPKKSSPSVRSTLSGSSGSLSDSSVTSSGNTDKEAGDEPKNSPQSPPSLLAPPRSEMPRTTSTGTMQSITASRPRPKARLSAGNTELMSGSLSLKTSLAPTRTYGLSTTAASTTATDTTSSFSGDLLSTITKTTVSTTQPASDDGSGITSKTIWDKINSPGTQRSTRANNLPAVTALSGDILQPTMVKTTNIHVVKKAEDVIPVAVALVETVNAYFKGKDMLKNTVNGDVTMSFPASAIKSLSAVNSPPVLSFAINGSNLLDNVLPNKTLILSDDQPNDVDVKQFKFKMPALLAHLKKLAEQGQAPYYNIDILKYQVQHNASLIPLSVSCFWKCEEKTTDVRVDYQYTPSCLSAASPLNNLSVIVPVNGGVEIMQSKPVAKWSKEHQKALWQVQEVSNSSEGQGSSSLRARFDLKEGPTVAQPVAVQFHCNGSTLSKIDFQLNTNMYKLSLVKRKIITGKYVADPAK